MRCGSGDLRCAATVAATIAATIVLGCGEAVAQKTLTTSRCEEALARPGAATTTATREHTVGQERLTVVRVAITATDVILCVRTRTGVVDGGALVDHLATASDLGGTEGARELARVVLALRLGDPRAEIYTNPEELARLATPMRRKVDRNNWPRTDPEEGGATVVTAIVYREAGGHKRLERAVVVIEPKGRFRLSSDWILHCDAAFPGGCGVVSLP